MRLRRSRMRFMLVATNFSRNVTVSMPKLKVFFRRSVTGNKLTEWLRTHIGKKSMKIAHDVPRNNVLNVRKKKLARSSRSSSGYVKKPQDLLTRTPLKTAKPLSTFFLANLSLRNLTVLHSQEPRLLVYQS